MDIGFLNYTVNNKHKFRLSSLDKDWTSQAITLPLFKNLTFSPLGPRGPASPGSPERPFGPSGPSSPLGPAGPSSPWKAQDVKNTNAISLYGKQTNKQKQGT